MAKYPRFSYRSMPEIGCGSAIILLVLAALCPPLVVVYFIILSIGDHFNITFENVYISIMAILLIISISAIPFLLIFDIATGDYESFWHLIFALTLIALPFVCIFLAGKGEQNSQPQQPTEKNSISNDVHDGIHTEAEADTIQADFPNDTTDTAGDTAETPNDINTDNDLLKNFVSKNDIIVYVTHRGNRYHSKDCPCIQGNPDILETTVLKAEMYDIPPCKICCKKYLQ